MSRHVTIPKLASLFETYASILNTLKRLGFSDTARHAELAFKPFFDKIYDTEFNVLAIYQAAIDLESSEKRLSIQVSTECSKDKIKETVKKFVSHRLYLKYDDLIFFFITSEFKPNLDLKPTILTSLEEIGDELDHPIVNYSLEGKVFDIASLISRLNEICTPAELDGFCKMFEDEVIILKRREFEIDIDSLFSLPSMLNEHLASLNIVDALYTIVKTYAGVAVFPTHIIISHYPFRADDRSVQYMDTFTLVTSNKTLVGFFRDLSIVDGKVKYNGTSEAILGVENFSEKIDDVLNLFEFNWIQNILPSHSFESIDISGLFRKRYCNCERCTLDRFELKNCLETIESSFLFNIEKIQDALRRASVYERLGKFKQAISLYNEIATESEIKQQPFGLLLAKMNLYSLRRLVKYMYHGSDKDSLLQDCGTNDVEMVCFNIRKWKREAEISNLVDWISRGEIAKTTLRDVAHIAYEIKKKKQLDQNGGYTQDNLYYKLLYTLGRFCNYFESNFLNFHLIAGHKEIFNLSLEGFLDLLSIQNMQSTRIDGIPDYLIDIFIKYADPIATNEILGRAEMQNFQYIYTATDEDKFIHHLQNILDNLGTLRDYATEFHYAPIYEDSIKVLSNYLVWMRFIELKDDDFQKMLSNLFEIVKEGTFLQWRLMRYFFGLIHDRRDDIEDELIERIIEWYYNPDRTAGPDNLNVLYLYQKASLRKKLEDSLDEILEIIESVSEVDSTSQLVRILNYWEYLSVDQRKRIALKIGNLLRMKFEKRLFVNSVLVGACDYYEFEHTYLKLFENTPQSSIPMKRERDRFFEEVYDDLNEFVLIAYKLKIDLTEERYQKLRIDDEYYTWLFDPENFDYDKFNLFWLVEYKSSILYERIGIIPKAKQGIGKKLMERNYPEGLKMFIQLTLLSNDSTEIARNREM